MFEKNKRNFDLEGLPMPVAIKLKDPKLLKILQSGEADELLSNYKVFRDGCLDLIFDYWRLSKILNKFGNKEDISTILETVERFSDTLKKQGFEIKDMTGNAYNDGLVVDVIHVEESKEPNVKSPFISETIRPAIYLNNRLIQKSEVVVTKPAQK